MLDINLIREKKEEVTKALLKKNASVDFSEVIGLDDERRRLIIESDTLKAKRNEVSGAIPKMKKEGKAVDGLLEEMKGVSEKIKTLDTRLAETKARIKEILERLPNIPDDDVKPGGKENNEVIRTFGEKPAFTFKAKDHIELATECSLIDYERGVKMGGNGFWLYKGDGALLEWGLLNYFIETHRADGYEFILPPHILGYECGYTAGQFPKFEDDVFHLEAEDGKHFSHFLLPTAETALINYHRDEILREEDLPKKYFAYTPCYRKEAGSYRTQERGMIRGHQFNKIEMFQFTTPETSAAALERLIQKAEDLVKGLGLHYRVSKLAAADCSASMAKTYDIEVWIPSMNEYKEVSSASNARDYQARRGNIRFKRKDTGKNEYIHSLNASGLATSRLLPAILEQFQREDGTVAVPDVLRPWMKKETLGKNQR
ncbi:MAG: serine--tRNA ligase [Spirochaetales bacterium]|nr:serine--tRNA ligase [Spirochaetales bacterium]